MKIKLTKQEVVNLFNGLTSVGKLEGVKFAYAVSKNIHALKSEVLPLQEVSTSSEDFILYERERVALAEKHAQKENGVPKMRVEDGVDMYVMLDQSKFDAEWKKLKEKHKKAIDKREVQLKELEKILKEEIEIEVHSVNIKDVPANIKTEQMTAILPIIEGDLTN